MIQIEQHFIEKGLKHAGQIWMVFELDWKTFVHFSSSILFTSWSCSAGSWNVIHDNPKGLRRSWKHLTWLILWNTLRDPKRFHKTLNVFKRLQKQGCLQTWVHSFMWYVWYLFWFCCMSFVRCVSCPGLHWVALIMSKWFRVTAVTQGRKIW